MVAAECELTDKSSRGRVDRSTGWRPCRKWGMETMETGDRGDVRIFSEFSSENAGFYAFYCRQLLVAGIRDQSLIDP